MSYCILRSEGKFLIYFVYDLDTREVVVTQLTSIRDDLNGAKSSIEDYLAEDGFNITDNH